MQPMPYSTNMMQTVLKQNQKNEKLIQKKVLENEFAKNHLLCRLIPLDNAHPNIPKESDYRPIVVTSPIIKILEQLLLIF